MSVQTKTSIPDALINFDLLPDSAYIRLPVVKALLSISVATVWRMVKTGQLKTHKLSPRTTAFNVGELRAELAKMAMKS